MNQHKGDTRRLEGRQNRKRVYREKKTIGDNRPKRAVLCPGVGPRAQEPQKGQTDRQGEGAKNGNKKDRFHC